MIRFRAPPYWRRVCFRHAKGRSESLLQSWLVDLREIVAQDRRCGLVMLEDCQAELGTGSPEKAEFALVFLSATSVQFLRNRQDGEAVGVIDGYGETQDRKMPCA
ncbi:hypothetical protein CQ12_08140 [Bradyrhizobium jicamae]|uniref:Uncharacterized protein n=1 Tax=Bradyrhizobium jicamae TaxID=280332 RepID=A0A0R3LMG6_9BRAD|nr:hypothetical protein CQ12_08140 [Bradyrhizobium jicamae]